MLVALRGQVWSTSQALATGVDSVPIDLLLGSLSPELAQQLKDLVPQVGAGRGDQGGCACKAPVPTTDQALLARPS
jgi:hypothetical protein